MAKYIFIEYKNVDPITLVSLKTQNIDQIRGEGQNLSQLQTWGRLFARPLGHVKGYFYNKTLD